MKRHILRLSLLISSTIVSSVGAADVLLVAEAPTAYNWSGGYLGLQGAWVATRTAGSQVSLAARQVRREGYTRFSVGDDKKSMGKLGLYGGYNAMLGRNVLAGAEVDFITGGRALLGTPLQQTVEADDFKKADGTAAEEFDPPLEDMQVDERASVLDFTTHVGLRARLGASFDRVLGYVVGGLGVLHGQEVSRPQQALYDAMILRYPRSEGARNLTRVTWSLGGGLELAVAENVILRGEYRYTSLPAQNDSTTRYFEHLSGHDNTRTEGVIVQYNTGKSWNHDWRLGIAAKF